MGPGLRTRRTGSGILALALALVLALLLVAAALLGVLAAILPNRRVTRLNVLEAVSYE